MTIDQQDILATILSRLPAKSIGRFRCVLKAWKSLLSQPRFIKAHLNRITQHPIQEQSLIFVSYHSQSLYSVKLISAHQVFDEMTTPLIPTKLILDDHPFEHMYIVDNLASCDGLIVVQGIDSKILLANPTTRETREVPKSPYALDHPHCVTLYGLGYDSSIDDYKVVTISYYVYYEPDDVNLNDGERSEIYDMSVNVYSVRNGTWKRVDDSPYDHAAGLFVAGVYFDGHIHWIAKKISDDSSVIAAFDLKEEKFREVPLSSSVACKSFLYDRLVVLEGCLCLSPNPPMCLDPEPAFFAMRKYNVAESWTKFTIIEHEKLGITPLCSLGKEQMVLFMNEDGCNEKIVMCNVKEGTFEDIFIQCFPEELASKGTFVESLLPPYLIFGDEAVHEE